MAELNDASPTVTADLAHHIRLRVNITGSPRIYSSAFFDLDVTLSNDSPDDLLWTAACPVHFGYHWIDAASGEVLVHNGMRTALGPGIQAGEQRRFQARVQAPPQPGTAILRASLVQEGCFWFDDVAPESAADLTFAVEDGTAWVENPEAPGVFAPYPALNNRAVDQFIRFRGQHRPLMLICETTNICNNHCIICAYDSQTRKKQHMASAVFEAAIKQYAELGGGGLSLTPVVGDVFLDKLLPDRLRVIAAHRDVITKLSVTTNASYAKLYDDEALEALLRHFDAIHLSVYGIDPDEFLTMTKVPEYELMRTGIERIFRLSRACITVGFRCLKERSRAELEAWVQAIPSFQAASDRITMQDNMRHFANWGIFDTSKPLPFAAAWIEPQPGEKAQCGIPLLALQVFSNGNVSFCPCDDFDNDAGLHLGNVMQSTLAEMFNGPKARALWDWATHGTPEFCKTCSFHRPLSTLISAPGLFENPLLAVGG